MAGGAALQTEQTQTASTRRLISMVVIVYNQTDLRNTMYLYCSRVKFRKKQLFITVKHLVYVTNVEKIFTRRLIYSLDTPASVYPNNLISTCNEKVIVLLTGHQTLHRPFSMYNSMKTQVILSDTWLFMAFIYTGNVNARLPVLFESELDAASYYRTFATHLQLKQFCKTFDELLGYKLLSKYILLNLGVTLFKTEKT
ncbi:hypothetical protein EGR_05868 [Echinococcus granulosus]|uniref:Uncharacterized protein n=1 Tax=Echinococcus granulosus TaxID=6210 RepID=W6UMB2_ECHGR|nr:hypothetical protein EGR_05868 [Echinococcus granulosus]EUB59267.1 hypothetical protein EGR_05868 [Echinococcus granulosus]